VVGGGRVVLVVVEVVGGRVVVGGIFIPLSLVT
jgi:hypothetical protein